MSGFAGVLHFDGAPADPDLCNVWRTRSRFAGLTRGAFGWAKASVSLTLFCAPPSNRRHETQPATLDHRVWCVC